MKKGDMRRKAILDVAEDMFMSRGYEASTVQDIIDKLGLSKGGFYHHFEAKEQLLEAICQEKAERSFAAAQLAVDACPGGAIDRLNALFDKNGIWHEDNVDFIGMLIRVAYTDENLLMREKLKNASIRLTLPLFNQIVQEGLDEGVFYTPYPSAIGELLLQLGHNLTDEIALMLLHLGEDKPDLVRVLERLELYRHAIEKLLDAPYGSIVLFQMGRMANICHGIWETRQAESANA